MTRIVWGRATSSNVMKVLWGLGELGQPFERIDVGGAFGKTDTPEYRAMNPTGLVPTLQEESFALWESNAILRYLGQVHASGTALWPADAQARAKIDHWMDAQQTVLNRPMGGVFWGLVRTPPDKRDMAAIKKAAVDAGKLFGRLDAHLADRRYVAGQHFTMGDIPVGCFVHRWYALEIERPELKNLRTWYDRLATRPAYAKHIMVKLT